MAKRIPFILRRNQAMKVPGGKSLSVARHV
ncbi:MAG: hypothetical protein JWM42_2705 [Burkholderia sp.]|jgi:hypothetical protein|nr:hypothetical protein [Burkholderia sp.]